MTRHVLYRGATGYLPGGGEGMAGLKKVLRKVGPVVAGAAAIAAGQPQLAVAAGSAVSAATKKKAKAPAYVEPPAPQVFLGNLAPADRNALMIGGAVVGTLVLSKLLFSRGR